MVKILQNILKKEDKIVFGYLFGSFAEESYHDGSDVDIALYFQDYNLDLHLDISLKISKALQRECDLVVLNKIKNLYLVENIISKGILLKDDNDKRVEFELQMHHDYIDFVEFKKVLNAS